MFTFITRQDTEILRRENDLLWLMVPEVPAYDQSLGSAGWSSPAPLMSRKQKEENHEAAGTNNISDLNLPLDPGVFVPRQKTFTAWIWGNT